MSKLLSHKLKINGGFLFLTDPQESFKITDIKKLFEDDLIHESMTIPNNWELAGLHNYNGTVWFLKEFELDSSDRNLNILKFFGVDYYTEVWLNWNYIGQHEGYFSPFSFNVSQFIKKNNIIIIKVNSPFETPGTVWPDRKRAIKGIFSHHDCRPGGNSKEFGQDQNTGGIWNDVFIEFGFKINIENVKVSGSINDGKSKAYMKAEISYLSIENASIDIPIYFQITSPQNISIKKNQKYHLEPGSKKINFYFEIDSPSLWWSWDLGDANLYKLSISSDYFDSLEISFGVREFYLDENQQFYLNKRRLFLRGTNIIPAQFLSDLSKEKIQKIVAFIKEANINIVRVHAHVNRTEFYEECSHHGILVWQDFSLQWTYEESLSFQSEAVKQIKEMVNHLYNHASIAVWCCHNEPGNQILSLDPLLEEAVYSEDTTRIVRRASNYEEHAYDGWYWGRKEHYAASPMGPLVTEFGSQALPVLGSLEKIVGKNNLFPPAWNAWVYHNFQIDQTFNIAKVRMGNSIETFIENSQDYQSEVLRTAIDFYRRKRFNGINGIFQFMLIDCWPSITWSVVDYYGKKKKAYQTLKNCYQPVYISINLRQDQYYANKKFLLDLYLINDLYVDFEDCIVKFYLDENEVNQINNLCLGKNSSIFINYEMISIIVPSILAAGDYKMELKLYDNTSSRIISENFFEFKVIELKY